VRLNGMPMGRLYRPYFAWYGDMDMATHLWELLGFGVAGVSVEFHAPVMANSFPSRKALSAYCRDVIIDGVAAALSGRERDGAGSADPGATKAAQAPSPARAAVASPVAGAQT